MNKGDVDVNTQYILGNVGSTKVIVDPMIRYHDIRILTEDNSVILDLSLLGYTALDTNLYLIIGYIDNELLI